MSKDIGPIIDLYEKFLIAFVGIVTPALTLYLNNYLIPKSKYNKWKVYREEDLEKRTILQTTLENFFITPEDKDFLARNKEELKKDKEKFKKWNEIVNELDPKSFFVGNVALLSLSMAFLFLWLFIRTEKFIKSGDCFFLFAQIFAGVLSMGLCGVHLRRLYEKGIYLIDVRLDVEEINEEIDKEIKQDEETKETQAGQQKASSQLELPFEENNKE